MINLFANKTATDTIKNFIRIASSLKSDNDFKAKRNEHIINSLEYIISNPERVDELCQINIENVGKQFLDFLKINSHELEEDELDIICALLFRFILEIDLSTKGEINRKLESVKEFVIYHIDSFSDIAQSQIKYANYEMPIGILKALNNNGISTEIKNIKSIKENLTSLKETLSEDIKEKEKNIERIKERLDNFETAFNFVGLYHGFDTLHKEKRIEKKKTLTLAVTLGALILLPISLQLFFVQNNVEALTGNMDLLLVSSIPSLSLVAILIYYFRIILANHNQLKHQIVQIELRKTLCSFIQNYSDYASEIKSKDPEALGKFENIIFSEILQSSGEALSAYDGIEKIIKAIKPQR